jgi:hypothetical protein
MVAETGRDGECSRGKARCVPRQEDTVDTGDHVDRQQTVPSLHGSAWCFWKHKAGRVGQSSKEEKPAISLEGRPGDLCAGSGAHQTRHMTSASGSHWTVQCPRGHGQDIVTSANALTGMAFPARGPLRPREICVLKP